MGANGSQRDRNCFEGVLGGRGANKDAAVKRFLQERYMPLGIGQPEDVAQAVVFLASPLAKFITGENLDVGGTLRGLI
jgi:NAD(P)-dependent dehydrogenase (short-subunit alcohol dehydrogenase family)